LLACSLAFKNVFRKRVLGADRLSLSIRLDFPGIKPARDAIEVRACADKAAASKASA
jgi:hypothetical protein